MKLLMIHGRSQGGKDPDVLRKEWEDSLRLGFHDAGLNWSEETEIIFPFYGDRLDALVERVEAPLVADVIERGASPDTSEKEFRGELLRELAEGAKISDEEIQEQFSGDVREKGPANWEWVQSILRALDRTPLGNTALDAFTRDVYVYLTVRAVRRKIDSIVSDLLPREPCVVVGHSLGSVVGYNVLRQAPPGTLVHRYITVGSPLGVKAIQRRLDTPLTMPACARGWYNALDERDVVALRALDEDHFAIRPPIENKRDVNNHTDNRHGVVGYLDNPDVARKIHEALETRH